MNIEYVIDEVFRDLTRVAAAAPNERLPKEEQIRSCIFATLRPSANLVCAERGYRSVDDGGRSECDLWVAAAGGETSWIELKTCWSVRGWNNKPSEQLSTWHADVAKLAETPTDSARYFALIGFFDFDPSDDATAAGRPLVAELLSFYQMQLRYSRIESFQWPNGKRISHVGAWVWLWRSGDVIRKGV